MTPEDFERERLASAETLARVVDGARGEPATRSSEELLGPSQSVKSVFDDEGARSEIRKPWTPPPPPDPSAVNNTWQAGFESSSGPVATIVESLSAKSREALVKFNANQVQFDNALLGWVAEHFSATHKHYDGVIGDMQKRMDEIDTRHRELERELVRHVHDMARRIDVVLGEGEKGRVSHESALRSIRERLRLIEEKLG